MTEKKIAKLEGKDTNNPVSDGPDLMRFHNRHRKSYLPQTRVHGRNSSQHRKEKSCTAVRQGEEKASVLADPLRYFNNPAFVDSLDVLTTNSESLSGRVRNYIRKRTQERNFRRRRANGSSQAERDFG